MNESKQLDPNERLMNCIFPDLDNRTCNQCLCCMNKAINPFCFELNKCVSIDTPACNQFERG